MREERAASAEEKVVSEGFWSGEDSELEATELTELGEKIFLDRYALKDFDKSSLSEGDVVIAVIGEKYRQREKGEVVLIEGDKVLVRLQDGEEVWCHIDHVDKPLELSPVQTIKRVARGVAQVEGEPERWEREFLWLMSGWKFIPGGRILSAAGSGRDLSLYNCYVLPSPEDSRTGIIDVLREQTEIMSRGGGVGINLSTLRPRHSYVKKVNGRSSGAVSWGALYSFATGLIEQGGSRRGALMLILEDWHPDILEFIDIKRDMSQITNANISVGISDKFMEAVEKDLMWELVFPDTTHKAYDTEWDGDIEKWESKGYPVVVYQRIPARTIWYKIIESAWSCAEPGIWFKDRSNKLSNSWYFAPLVSCNPCGEQPLPAYGVCNLGSLNLPKFLVKTGDWEWEMDWDKLERAVRLAVRFLDDVIDIDHYVLEGNRRRQTQERRIGLGTMGLAELLIRLKLRYGSPSSLKFIDKLYKFIATTAYKASIELAKEKGPFPMFDAEKYLQSGFMKNMPEEIRSQIAQHGIRNVTLLTQPPTGTTGTMVNTSTGIEPFFFWEYQRMSRLGVHTERASVYSEWLELNGPDTPLPDYFVTAMDLTPEEHVKVVAAIQRWVDSAISKTSNLPADYTVEQTAQLYELMYKLGCKGGTIYRDGSRDQQVLSLKKDEDSEETEGTKAFEGSEAIGGDGEEVRGTDSSEGSKAVGGEEEEKVRPRPYRRFGVTYSKKTPVGTAHITMNDDQEGHPFEVFVDLGKAGSDIKAMAEALGRLLSLILRIKSPLTPLERIEEIVNQLKGIGGATSLGFGPDKVLSLPDAVGKVLEEHYLKGERPVPPWISRNSRKNGSGANGANGTNGANGANGTNGTNGNGVSTDAFGADGGGGHFASDWRAALENRSNSSLGSVADICPSCGQSSFIRADGCENCLSCGYSRC